MHISIAIICNYAQLQMTAVLKGVFQTFILSKIDRLLYTCLLECSAIFQRRGWFVSQDTGMDSPHPEQFW